MPPDPPIVVVIGGPNGAGKTTISEQVLADTLRLHEFVNADMIARGLSAFNAETAAIAAGRVMLTRLRELAGQRTSFAFESTPPGPSPLGCAPSGRAATSSTSSTSRCPRPNWQSAAFATECGEAATPSSPA